MSPVPAVSCPVGAPLPPAGEPRPPAAATPLAASVAAASGNRCGHVPDAPRFDLVTLPENANHARPALIGKAIGKLKAYYESPRQAHWDPISQSERHCRLERQIAAAGGPETEAGRPLAERLARWRQQRSERRESVVAVMALLLAYTDIDSLIVAVPAKGGGNWLGLSVPWIAAHTGLSASRVKRALATLDRAGLLKSTGAGRRFDQRQRRWVGAGWGPVRRVSFGFVRMLGLEVSWTAAQRRRRKQQARAAHPAPAPAAGAPVDTQAMIRQLRQALSPGAGAKANRPADTAPAPARPADTAQARRIAELAAQGLSPADIRARLAETPQAPQAP